MKKALVGTARDPHCPDGRWYPVVGYEFADTPGYYEFSGLTDPVHWRPFAQPSDYLAEIPYRVAVELKDQCHAATIEPWRRSA